MSPNTDLSAFNRKEKKGIFEKSSEKSSIPTGNGPKKTVGRPRKDEVDRKTKQVTVYCTNAEYEKLENMRSANIGLDIPMGAYVRRLLIKHIF